MVKNRPTDVGDTRDSFHSWVMKIPLEKEMATHSRIFA